MNKFIKESLDSGYNPLVLEPQIKLNKSIVGVDNGRLIYHVDTLLQCLAEDVGDIAAIDRFVYETLSTTKMAGGPLFFDENEITYLTMPYKTVKIEVYNKVLEDK